ncbi:MAG: SRPBCC family protein, partial [Acidimicrobiia bacterium]|nr:SRPBCC family protein [Acidimicrobiia bacterium]
VTGGTFVGRNARGERRWETTSLVTEAEPGRVFAWAVQTDGLPGSTWRIEIEPGDSGVLVKHSAQLGPGNSGLTAAIEKYPEDAERIKAGRAEAVREGMEAVLAGLKAAAES